MVNDGNPNEHPDEGRVDEAVQVAVAAPPENVEERPANRSTSDPRMDLSPAQKSWAISIKEAIEADPELDNLSDYWYAQLAIVVRDDVQSACQKARTMQYFRQEYDVRDTIEDAKKTVWDLMNLFDNWVLSFSYNSDDDNYVWVVDIEKIDNRALQTERAWRTNLAGVYYLRQAMNPDLLSISNGISIFHECHGFDFSGKFGGLGHVSRLAQEVIGDYPALHGQLRWFHTSSFVNIMMAMVKRFLPKEMKDKFQFGCLYENRLDSCFLVPDPHTAKVRTYGRIIEALQKRYENDNRFRL